MSCLLRSQFDLTNYIERLEHAYSGVLRLATPVFGISNNSNFNHYKVPHFLKDGCYSSVSLYQMFVE